MKAAFFDKSDIYLLAIFFLSIVATAYVHPFLPEQFAIHMNSEGELGNYVSKAAGAWLLLIFLPLELLFMNGVKWAAVHSSLNTTYDYETPDDKDVKIAYRMNRFMIIVKVCLFSMLVLLHFAFLFVNLGSVSPVQMNVMIPLFVGVFYVILGIFMYRFNIPDNVPGWNGRQPEEVNKTVMYFTRIGFILGGVGFPFYPLFNEPFSIVWILLMLGCLPIGYMVYGIRQGKKQWSRLKAEVS